MTPRPGWRCSPPSTAPPIPRRRRRPVAAWRRWSGRSATPAHCVRSPAPTAHVPRGRAGPAGGCRRAPRRDSARRARPWRPTGAAARGRCRAPRSIRLVIRSPFRAIGQFGAVAPQGVPTGHFVVRHRGQRRRVGVHTQRRRDGRGGRRRPHDVVHPPERERCLVACPEPPTPQRLTVPTEFVERIRTPASAHRASRRGRAARWRGPCTQLISQMSSSSSPWIRVYQRSSVGTPPGGRRWS